MIVHATLKYFNLIISLIEVRERGCVAKKYYLKDEDDFAGCVSHVPANSLEHGLELYAEACNKILLEINKEKLDKKIGAGGMINPESVEAPVVEGLSEAKPECQFVDKHGRRSVSDMSRRHLEQALCQMIKKIDLIRHTVSQES